MGQADARGDVGTAGAQQERVGDDVEDAVGQEGRDHVGVLLLADHGELIGTDAGHDVARADGGPQSGGDGDDQLITGAAAP